MFDVSSFYGTYSHEAGVGRPIENWCNLEPARGQIRGYRFPLKRFCIFPSTFDKLI